MGLLVGALLDVVDNESVNSDIGEWLDEEGRELVKSMTSCMTAVVLGVAMLNGRMLECSP